MAIIGNDIKEFLEQTPRRTARRSSARSWNRCSPRATSVWPQTKRKPSQKKRIATNGTSLRRRKSGVPGGNGEPGQGNSLASRRFCNFGRRGSSKVVESMAKAKAPASPPLSRGELATLLNGAKEFPGDLTPRLVLADWLEEHGDTARAWNSFAFSAGVYQPRRRSLAGEEE